MFTNTICNNICSNLSAQENNFRERSAPKGRKAKKIFAKESARLQQNRRLLQGLVIAEEIEERVPILVEQTPENIPTNYHKLLEYRHKHFRRCSKCNKNICFFGQFCNKPNCPYCHEPDHHCCMICGKIPCGNVVRFEDGCADFNKKKHDPNFVSHKDCMTKTHLYCHHSNMQRVFAEKLLLSIYATCTMSTRIEKACSMYQIDINDMHVDEAIRRINAEIDREPEVNRQRYNKCRRVYEEQVALEERWGHLEEYWSDLAEFEQDMNIAEEYLHEPRKPHIDEPITFKSIVPTRLNYPGTIFDDQYPRFTALNTYNIPFNANPDRQVKKGRNIINVGYESVNLESLHVNINNDIRLIFYVKYERLLENNEQIVPTVDDFPAL